MATPLQNTRLALLCALLLALAASFSLLGCGGCAGNQPRQAQKQASSGEAARSAAPQLKSQTLVDVPILPPASELSPRAGATYTYLLLLQAFLREDETALLDAIPLLRQARAPAQNWLEAGLWLMGRKSPNTIVLLEQALQVWPEETSLTLLCAEALVEHGTPDRGVALIRAFLQKNPNSLDARLELALLLVKTRQFSEAENLLESVSPKERTPLVDYYHARALIGMNRQGEAVPYLQKAVKGMPDFAEAQAELAFVYEQLDKLHEARKVYEDMARLDYSRQDVLLRLVSISLRLKQPQKALGYMRQGPNSEPFKMAVAGMLIEGHYYTEAESLLKELTAQRPPHEEAYLMLAELTWLHRQNLPQALAWLDKVTPTGRNFARSRLIRAQLLAEAGQHDNARLVLAQGQKDFAHLPDFYEFEVRLLAGQRKMDEAATVAREACRRWPDNGDLAFLLGSLLDEKGEKAAALTIMEELVKRQPDNYQALNYVGYTLAEQGRDLERALQMLTRADSLAPDQAYIVDSLAWALFKAGRTEEAFSQIRRAAELNEQNDPTIWEHYGDIARSLGHTEEARKAYNEALKLKPANAESIRQRLTNL
ncbi:MAG: tetratricopeptide repeat protein [Desulfovibrionaceae bacterium]|nr:tetratricopeptide repeat protein [Desulfovibrionaceae bacterium]